MRYVDFPTSWIGLFGQLIEVDVEETLKQLENKLEHYQDEDAYWEAVDILKDEKPLSLSDKDYWERYNFLKSKLLNEVENKEGYLNRGQILKSGHGRAWWEKLSKEDSIRWALALWILY